MEFAKKCLENLSGHQINPSPHFITRMKQRSIPDEWVSDCLLNKKPFRIIKQDEYEDRFRLFYDHPKHPEKEN